MENGDGIELSGDCQKLGGEEELEKETELDNPDHLKPHSS